MIHWLAENAVGLSLLLTALGILGSGIRYVWDRRREFRFREFKAYHRLVKELVSPDPESGAAWIDRQGAVVFELRDFRRYHEYTVRMLLGLKNKWNDDPKFEWPQLINELNMTLNHIRRKHRDSWWRNQISAAATPSDMRSVDRSAV